MASKTPRGSLAEQEFGGKSWGSLDRLVAAGAAIPVAIVTIGAAAARPIADDYSILAKISTEGGAAQALSLWMTEWTPYYSGYGMLTFGAAVLDSPERQALLFPTFAIIVLLAALSLMGFVWRIWASDAESPSTAAVGTLVLTAGALGSFFSLAFPRAPFLFASFNWATASISHLYPILLGPIVLFLVLRPTHHAKLRMSVAFCAGIALAGFGLAESGMLIALSVISNWALLRMGGKTLLRLRMPHSIAHTCGLLVGTVAVLALPGTAVRAKQMQLVGDGIQPGQKSTETLIDFLHHMSNVATGVLLSAALPVGFIAGFVLYRLSDQRLPSGEISSRKLSLERARLEHTAMVVLAVVVGTGWISVSVGDLVSSEAVWHLTPLIVPCYLLFCVFGWRAARSLESLVPNGAVALIGVGCLVGVIGLTAGSSHASWSRRSVFDRNVTAAQAESSEPNSKVAVWHSVEVGGISDAEPSTDEEPWVTDSIMAWLRLSEEELSVEEAPGLSGTIWLPGFEAYQS